VVDCGEQVVVPFGAATRADRLRTDSPAATAHAPWGACHPPALRVKYWLHALGRAGFGEDERPREGDRWSASPTRWL